MKKVKTIKQRVMDKITTAEMAQVGRKAMYVLPHKSILKLSASADSATRRLREMAAAYGKPAYTHKDDKIVFEAKFVNWLQKQ